MESRIQHLFLSRPAIGKIALGFLVLAGLTGALPAAAAAKPEALELEPLVVREPERREVKIDRIDSENFEIGVSGGIMSVQDFGSDLTTSFRFAYHVSESFFVEGQYGKTTLGETSFERLSGGASLLTDDERDMRQRQ